MIYSNYIKQILDFSLSLFVLIIILPIIIIVSLILLCKNSGKILFLQYRPGKNGKIFKLYKFKTMNDKKDLNGNLISDELRLTNIGKIIRKYSLDELLQFFNVLKGEMSIIGPRPLLKEYLPLFNEEQKKRHLVKPGITGWAQVNGRNAITWEEKFKLDVWYVENISFFLDIKIFFHTIVKIFKKEGINSNTSATMEKFTGNKN
ncbi:MAG: sugar transferase [Melioribacteraceae bacterium]